MIRLFTLAFFLLFSAFSIAQQSACPSNTPGADECADACIHCSLSGYTGSTAAYSASANAGFCASVENDQWIGFLAADTVTQIVLSAFNCTQNKGLEAALYTSCGDAPLVCGLGASASPFGLTAVTQPGQVYFLSIDGQDGDQCQFAISSSNASGAVPAVPVLSGPSFLPNHSSGVFSIQAVPGANRYIWSAPLGAKINGQAGPLTLTAASGTGVSIEMGVHGGVVCVRAANDCGEGDAACLDLATQGYLPAACNGPILIGAFDCTDACVICDFTGGSSNNFGYPGSFAVGFCGTLDATAWYGLTAGMSGTAEIVITPYNCENGDGLQMALYPSCEETPLTCNGGAVGGGNTPISLQLDITSGQNYYLLVDGYAGDHCEFNINAIPSNAFAAPEIVWSGGALAGPTLVCPGGTAHFSAPIAEGASVYSWLAPAGAKINGQGNMLLLEGPGGNTVDITFGNAGGQVCVQALNACNTGNTMCKAITVAPIPPTHLQPLIFCAEDDLILPWGDPCPSSGQYCHTYNSQFGCDSVVCVQVSVRAPIVYIMPPRVLCPGDTMWVCGDSYTAAGSYTAVCTSYQGCDSTVYFILQDLNQAAQIQSDGLLNCQQTAVVLSSAPASVAKSWRKDGGPILGSGDQITVSEPGAYILDVSVASGSGSCTLSDTLVVEANYEAPDAWAQDALINCVNPCVPLPGGSSTAGASWVWNGPGVGGEPGNPLACAAGLYTLVVTHPISACTSTATAIVLSDIELPQILLTYGSLTLSCVHPVVSIGCVNFNPAWQVEWSGPNGFISNVCGIDMNTPGTYYFTVTDPQTGCQTTQIFEIQQDTNVPNVQASGSNISCAQPEAQLLASSSTAGVSFWWMGPGGEGTPNPNPVTTQAGAYILVVTAPNGCTNSAVVVVGLDTLSPGIQLDALVDDTGTGTGAIAISINNGNVPYSVQWVLNGLPYSDQEDISGLGSGTYTVTVISNNGCSTTLSVSVGIIAVNTVPLAADWQLSPNPAQSRTELRYIGAGAATRLLVLELYNAEGKLLRSWEPVAGDQLVYTIDLQELPAGFYQLNAVTEKGTFGQKIVVR